MKPIFIIHCHVLGRMVPLPLSWCAVRGPILCPSIHITICWITLIQRLQEKKKTCIVDHLLHHRDSISVSIGEQCMHQHQFTPSQASSGSLSSSTGWACLGCSSFSRRLLICVLQLLLTVFQLVHAATCIHFYWKKPTTTKKPKLSKPFCVSLKFAFCTGHTQISHGLAVSKT